jgi:internalin A
MKSYEICEESQRRFLLLKGPWNDGALSIMRKEGVRALRLSAYAGWREDNIAFLDRLPFLESLDLLVPKLEDVTPLYALPNLRRLSLNGVNRKIDFTKMPTLEDLHLSHWRPGKYDTVFQCGLKSFAVASYPEPDLRAIGAITTLENLAVSFSKVGHLKGVAGLPKLVRLSLAGLSNLRTLDGIEDCGRLLLLWIEQLKNLARIEAVNRVRTLRSLNLSDCPNIASLRPITDLPDLEAVWFFGKTNILDGDLVPIATLPKLKYAKFTDRPHYSHHSDEFPKSSSIFR